MEKTVALYTLGCRVNQYESDAISAAFSASGFKVCDFSDVCDVYVINTCTVTVEADRKARNAIARAHRRNKYAVILVCGCYAQVAKEKCAELEGVSYVCGTRNKLSVVQKAVQLLEDRVNDVEINVSDNEKLPIEKMEGVHTDRTRAFIKIEDGCPNNCTYCIIKNARGPVSSRMIEDIITETQRLAQNGFTEIVFTGIETASFGKDNGQSLPELIEKASKIEQIKRIRLGSMDPSYMREDIAKRILDVEKFMPHMHLSLQSGSDRILALMKRKYNSSIAVRNIENMLKYRPEMKFSADFIVGFPTETEEDFACSLSMIENYPFIHSHIFKYSKREGTEAAKMSGQVPSEIKTQRSARMTELQEEKNILRAKELISSAKVHEVLFEDNDKEYIYAHSKDFSQFKIKLDGRCRCGEYAEVKVVDIQDQILVGELI